MRLKFHKMHGAGNDFVVVDDRPLPRAWANPRAVADLAARRLGIGSEGVILLKTSARADFRMRFFNPDGSEADLCGNGARCVARFAHAIGAAPRAMRFETPAGMIEAELLPGGTRVTMPPTGERRGPLRFTLDGQSLRTHAVLAGVPHLVAPVEDVRAVDVLRWGRALRSDPAFAPQGTNVNFISPRSNGDWDLRTYERGVEDESGACGTGAVAAATIAHALLHAPATVAFHTRDGFVLRVCVSNSNAPTLEGPAVEVFQGEITLRKETLRIGTRGDGDLA